jgi:acetyl-CoA acetyltransferase
MATNFRDKAAIAGIGYTKFSKNSGVSTLALATEAIVNAAADAGLPVDQIDGLAMFALGDSTPTNYVAQALGLPDLRYYVDQWGGGSVSQSIVGQAALACLAGMADYVVCYRSLNSRSEWRMGGTGREPLQTFETQYSAPYGFLTPPQTFAMACRAHMVKYGTTSEQLGHIAVSERHNASLNDRAMQRLPITLEDYLNSRWIADPFRFLDCCLETDGACAVLVTTAERAKDLRQKPVYISSAAWGPGRTMISSPHWVDLTDSAAERIAPRLYQMAGVGPEDIDVAELYDCFTYMVMLQLEAYGFCPKGEGGPFAASGAIELGGKLPVNTHGGFLSEGYIHGLNHVCEAVQQLRGQAGPRQVPGAEVALSTGQAGVIGSGFTSALILRN